MRLTVDLDSLQLIVAAGDRRRVSSLEFKRGDSTPLEVQFVRSGVAEALPEGAVLAFALKEAGKYDDGFAVFFDTFDAPTADPDFIYAGTPSFNTTELDALLLVDGDSANDKAYVDLMGELSWSVASADPVSIRTFTARVNNDVIRGDEGAPTTLPTPDAWLSARAVRYDAAQTLAAGEQEQARENIGITLSSGGNGVADSGAVVVFAATGGIELSRELIVQDSTGTGTIAIQAHLGAQSVTATSGSFFASIVFPALPTSNQLYTLPDQTGTFAFLEGDQAFTGAITAPNQTAAAGSSVMTRDLVDTRMSGPKFRARMNSSQAVVTSTFTKLAFSTEEFDTAGTYDPALYRFQPTKAGYYNVSVSVRAETNANSTQLYLYKNGASEKILYQRSAHSPENFGAAVLVSMNGTTDYLEVYVWHNKGSNLNLVGDTQHGWFSANYVP